MPRNRSFRENTAHVPANPPRPAEAGPTMTEPQARFLRSLLDERQIDEQAREQMLARIDADDVSKSRASDWIKRLLDKPKVGRTKSRGQDLPDVPAGRYAVTGDDGETDFYKVDRPTKGSWAGSTFVKLITGPDERNMSDTVARTILERIIADGPANAAIRYGREIKHCSVCNIQLTNNLSRALGIGPVCGGRFYDDDAEWKAIKKDAAEDLEARGIDPKGSNDDVEIKPNDCPNCGPGECYHICPNSPHYYTPEQERYDDAMDDGSDDVRERYAGEVITEDQS
jgi:hypothetical protein